MAYTANKLKSNLIVRTYFDDNATAATARFIAWVPMGMNFMALCTFGAGTGVLTFKIFAATSAAGAGSTEVAAHATPTTADASGDQLVLEVSQEQVRAALSGATHVSVEIDNDDNADENAITYVMEPRDKADAKTADIIA